MNTVKKYINIIYSIFKCCFMSALEYRANYILRATIELSNLVVNLCLYKIIYTKVDSIAGWGYNQMILLVLTAALLDSGMTFFFHKSLSEIPSLIQNGNMDLVFLKPINSRVYLSFHKFETSQLINLLIMLGAYIYFVLQMGVTYTPLQIVVSVLLLLNGIFILYNLYFLIMILSFWTVKVDNGASLFYQLYDIGNKPMEVFPKILRGVFIYIVPMFVAFNFSVKYVCHALSTYYVVAAFICSAVIFLITQIVFKSALGKYTSAGA